VRATGTFANVKVMILFQSDLIKNRLINAILNVMLKSIDILKRLKSLLESRKEIRNLLSFPLFWLKSVSQ